MSKYAKEIEKRRTFAIISHPDAGKTTLTEKFLLYGGAINLAGSVKGKATSRHAVSDYMEKQETYQKEVKEYHDLYAEQSKNMLSAVSVLVLILGFASGVLLARVVWRKM